MRTVGQPGPLIMPPWAVESKSLAAGMLPMSTVAEPLMMVLGGPTQTAGSPKRAAGRLPISTVGQPALIRPGSVL